MLSKFIAGFGLLLAGPLPALVAPAQAQTQDCRLVSFGELSISHTPGGRAILPAAIDGKPIALALDLESPFSVVAQKDAADWHVPVREGEVGLVKQGRDALTDIATFGVLSIGDAHINGFQAFVENRDMHGADVVLGLNLLRNFTPEFDIGHDKVRLFGKAHCPDKLVYWSPDYLQMTYQVVADRVLIEGRIDGTAVHAALVPGLAHTTVSDEARTRLNLTRPDGGTMLESLEFGGIKLRNLVVDAQDLTPGKTYFGAAGANLAGRREPMPTDLLLGDDVLKHLRFMIDFDTKTISFTVG